MHFRYCPDCGSKLGKKTIGDEGIVPYCSNCQKPLFDLPTPCTITIAVNEDGEAALLRQNYISTNSYVLVSGYVKCGENAEECASREVLEELGVEPIHMEYLGSFYYEKKDMVMLAFEAKVKKAAFHISQEVDRAEWVRLEETGKYVREGSIASKVCDIVLRKNN